MDFVVAEAQFAQSMQPEKILWKERERENEKWLILQFLEWVCYIRIEHNDFYWNSTSDKKQTTFCYRVVSMNVSQKYVATELVISITFFHDQNK